MFLETTGADYTEWSGLEGGSRQEMHWLFVFFNGPKSSFLLVLLCLSLSVSLSVMVSPCGYENFLLFLLHLLKGQTCWVP